MPKLSFAGLHVAQRAPMAAWKAALLRVAAVLLALVVGGLILLCLGYNPLLVYQTMLNGALAKKTARASVVRNAVPLAIGMHLYLNKTHCGLNLRAIGENPGAADAAGVNVTLYKYVHLLIGGAICGLGGAYISLVTCAGNWQQDCVSGQGWIAVALVIFVSWKPAKALWGAFFFGALRILKLYVPASVISLPSAFYLMLPFAVTCVVLVLSSIRMRRENQAPAACGVNYFREER